MKVRDWLNGAAALFGVLSFLSLGAFYLALTDIGHDYASPDVWLRAGAALPDWYSPVNRCPLEWRVLQVGFLVMLTFHLLLFLRLLLESGRNDLGKSRVP